VPPKDKKGLCRGRGCPSSNFATPNQLRLPVSFGYPMCRRRCAGRRGLNNPGHCPAQRAHLAGNERRRDTGCSTGLRSFGGKKIAAEGSQAARRPFTSFPEQNRAAPDRPVVGMGAPFDLTPRRRRFQVQTSSSTARSPADHGRRRAGCPKPGKSPIRFQFEEQPNCNAASYRGAPVFHAGCSRRRTGGHLRESPMAG